MLAEGNRADRCSIFSTIDQQRLAAHDHTAAEAFAQRQALVRHALVEVHQIDVIHHLFLFIDQADDKRVHGHEAFDGPVNGDVDLIGIEAGTDLGAGLVQNGESFSCAYGGLIQAGILQADGGLVGDRARQLDLGQSEASWNR